MPRAVVILAGGAGTRLHPLSTEETPKQFLKLFGGQSLLVLTYHRAARVVGADAIFISTNERYRSQVLEQLPDLPAENVITEPARRNTAPAIALCTFTIARRLGEEVAVAFLASDHFIAREDLFALALERAFSCAESSQQLVAIGIHPTTPDTGFGYLELGEELEPDLLRVRRFTEKPSLECAEEFLRAGNYAWNASMFVWQASIFRRELETCAPEFTRISMENYAEMPSISIDYALMEKSPHVATIRGDFGWSDVGTFAALRKAGADIPDDIETSGGGA